MRVSMQNKIAATSVAAAGAGAALMFFFDPARGKRRRALVRDKAAKVARESSRSFLRATRDLGHRTQGVVAETRSQILPGPASDDVVLVERIHSKLGRIVSHPSAIDVVASNGSVTLRGDVLEAEVRDLVSRVSSIRGVVATRNELRSHAKAEGVPRLQGLNNGRERTDTRGIWATPGTRMLVGFAGGALSFYGARKRGPLAKLFEIVGLGLLGGELTAIGLSRVSRTSTKGNGRGNILPASPLSNSDQERIAKHEEWK